MPASYVKSLADKYKIPVEKLEKYWKEAKKIIKDYGEYDNNPDKMWGTIVKVFKNKINKHLGLQETYINFKTFIEVENDMNNFKKLLEAFSKKGMLTIADAVGNDVETIDVYWNKLNDLKKHLKMLKKKKDRYEAEDTSSATAFYAWTIYYEGIDEDEVNDYIEKLNIND